MSADQPGFRAKTGKPAAAQPALIGYFPDWCHQSVALGHAHVVTLEAREHPGDDLESGRATIDRHGIGARLQS